MRSFMNHTFHRTLFGDKIKNEMGEHVVCMGERRGACRVLVRKPEGKRHLGNTRHRWEDNIKIGLQEIRWDASIGLMWLIVTSGGVL
jgi:hypothetical protein